MKKQICIATLLALPGIPFTTMASTPTCADPKGVWVNELKSTLEISSIDSASGMIEGTYSSPSGTSGEKFKLIGWVNNASELNFNT